MVMIQAMSCVTMKAKCKQPRPVLTQAIAVHRQAFSGGIDFA
jgi:hypothetical protein